MTEIEHFVDATKASEFLSMDRRTIVRWARKGIVPAITKDKYESIGAWQQGGGK